jgi:hypothetical protein
LLLLTWCSEVEHKSEQDKAELNEILKFWIYCPCNETMTSLCELMDVGGSDEAQVPSLGTAKKLNNSATPTASTKASASSNPFSQQVASPAPTTGGALSLTVAPGPLGRLIRTEVSIGSDTTINFDAIAAKHQRDRTGAYLDSPRSTAGFIEAHSRNSRMPDTSVTDGQEPIIGSQPVNHSSIDCQEMVSDSRDREPITTFMLRNIPNRMKVVDLQQRICDLGFGDTYDFLYVPFDLRSEQNKGYAFVNLVTQSVAMDFAKRFNGTKFDGFNGRLSSKEVLVCNAAAQGVAENLRRITKE